MKWNRGRVALSLSAHLTRLPPGTFAQIREDWYWASPHESLPTCMYHIIDLRGFAALIKKALLLDLLFLLLMLLVFCLQLPSQVFCSTHNKVGVLSLDVIRWSINLSLDHLVRAL